MFGPHNIYWQEADYFPDCLLCLLGLDGFYSKSLSSLHIDPFCCAPWKSDILGRRKTREALPLIMPSLHALLALTIINLCAPPPPLIEAKCGNPANPMLAFISMLGPLLWGSEFAFQVMIRYVLLA